MAEVHNTDDVRCLWKRHDGVQCIREPHRSGPHEIQNDDYVAAWNALRVSLQERYTMAREVLEENELGHVAALVPIEEVLSWMDVLEGRTDES